MIDSMMGFFDMGDHAAYVWSAWGIAMLIIAVMAIAPVLRWRAFEKQANATHTLTAEPDGTDEEVEKCGL